MFWILISIVLLVFIWRSIKTQLYWRERNVLQDTPIPIFGDSWKTFFRFESFTDAMKRQYARFPNARYSGVYQMTSPTLVLRDPELIKQLTVKDFDSFTDHRTFLPDNAEPLWSKNLFALRGDAWRDMRATLSPAFTSSKMKAMFCLMNECAEQFTGHFEQLVPEEAELEMKDSFTRYSNDVIASCAFGVRCDSLKDKENEFYVSAKNATDFGNFWRNFKIFLHILFPQISNLLQLKFFSTEVKMFFTSLVKDTIKVRQEKNVVRPDVLHLLLEARKGRLLHEEETNHSDTGFATVQESHIGKARKHNINEITDVDITAQAMIFFFAGFDTVSNLMSFMSYELALNPDIQQRLFEEIRATNEACKGNLSYDHLTKMRYMDMVISESLRKWPPVIGTDRICVHPYTIQPYTPEEKPVTLHVGQMVMIPTAGIHYDPKYYPEPERFDPERFSDENKEKIVPYTYLPFGVGPRNCIGSRFAIMETKVLFYHLLSKFEIVVCERTQIPFRISRKSFAPYPENGNWLGLKRRNNN